MDAYSEHRYGSFIPQHLATKEFFELAAARLGTNGVLAYNVIGTWRSGKPDLVGALYKTLQAVFPQVYGFPASDSQNVVLIATREPRRLDFNALNQRAAVLLNRRRVTLPTFRQRLYALQSAPPASAARAPLLTGDHAPVEGYRRGFCRLPGAFGEVAQLEGHLSDTLMPERGKPHYES